ncbi:hypothetical protein ACHAXH_008711 [Discostella pseudostelligera]
MELNVDYSQQDIDIRRIQRLPILHVSQSLILHDEIKLFTDDYFNSLDPPTQCIATAQVVALIVGLDCDLVVPLKTTTPSAPLHKFESDNHTGSTS